MLSYLHGQGIVHRDIKLEHVHIDELYQIKLCGFGSAIDFYDNLQGKTFLLDKLILEMNEDVKQATAVIYQLLTGESLQKNYDLDEVTSNLSHLSSEAKHFIMRGLNLSSNRKKR